jgi:ElaB/YqjD/DUF883 family membrane-anchored ribosome-binding protein
MSHIATTAAPNGSHVKQSAVALKDAVADLASEAGRMARHRYGIAKESAASMMTTVKTKAETCNDNVVGFIRKNPYSSLAIAAGLGLGLGFLLRRRR